MQALRFLFSPSGRIGPQAFIVAVIVVYAAGIASQLLTQPEVLLRRGLWPFAVAQALLTWMWFALHAKRLRDADGAVGLAVGASLLYALAVVLLLIVATAFVTSAPGATGANTTGVLGLMLLISIITTLSGSSNYDLAWLIVVILVVLAFVPLIVAVAVTVFAATRPSAAKP